MNKPTKIIVHHTAILTTDLNPQFEVIKKNHIDKGWGDIGYNFLIEKSGEIREGRNITISGAHTIGQNSSSIGICLAGNFEKEIPTAKQLSSLQYLIKQSNMSVYGHKDWWPTKCPGKNLYRKWDKKMEKFKTFINEYGDIFFLDGDTLIKFKEPKRYNSFKEKDRLEELEKMTDKELREKYIYAEQIG